MADDAEGVEVGLGAGVVEPLAERRAVRERDPQVGVGDVDLEAALRELELVDHEVVEQAHDVGARAHDEVGVGERALERARAAEPLAALEHEHRLAGPGEVGRAGQPVVAAADHDGVPVARGELVTGAGRPTSPSCSAISFMGFSPRWLRRGGAAGSGVDGDGAAGVDEHGVELDELEAR